MHEHRVEMLPLGHNPAALAAEFDRRSAAGWDLILGLPMGAQSLVATAPQVVLMCVFRRVLADVAEEPLAGK
jgi:hypothetical protein